MRNWTDSGSTERCADPLGTERHVVLVEPRMHLDHQPDGVVAVVAEQDVARRRARQRETGRLAVVARIVVVQRGAVEHHLGGHARFGGDVLTGEVVGFGLLRPALVLLGDVAGRVVWMGLALTHQSVDGATRDERHRSETERSGERRPRRAALDPDHGTRAEHEGADDGERDDGGRLASGGRASPG